jgi:hypothetical protein
MEEQAVEGRTGVLDQEQEAKPVLAHGLAASLSPSGGTAAADLICHLQKIAIFCRELWLAWLSTICAEIIF